MVSFYSSLEAMLSREEVEVDRREGSVGEVGISTVGIDVAAG